MVQIREFTVDLVESALDDLRDRLRRTRYPDAETVPDWSQGVPLDYLRELTGYWANDYDMHRLADRLNAYPQFQAGVDELGVHLLHVRSPSPKARPLVMTHGWPGSVLEFDKVIGPLTDPVRHGAPEEDAFHLVMPSLPGYGFSAKPTRPGTGATRIATAWHGLMGALGYPEYYAQGGDWGAIVTAALGAAAPPGLLGIHLNMAVLPPAAFAEVGEPTEAERGMLAGMRRHRRYGAGYAIMQATRPQTLGAALADSPAGQLAWIVEKFYAWTDCEVDGRAHPENVVSRDELLDNVTLYWLTNSAASSARLYWESYPDRPDRPVTVPSAYTQFPKEIYQVSERWLRTRYTDLRYFHTQQRGGHFAALERPAEFVTEVRAAVRAMSAGSGRT